MSHFKIFKNKKTNYHPSVSVSIRTDKVWENIEITSSPTSNGRYERLMKNPNPNTPKKIAWFRKYIRKDPLWAKGEEFTNYKLCDEDELKISNFIERNKKAGFPTDQGIKRLNQLGNQANHRTNGHMPCRTIKTNRKRLRKRKHNKQIR